VGWGPLAVSRDRFRDIFGLALPIIGGMVSQNVLNIVDTLMVSQLGPSALAAVGLAGFTNFLCMAFVTGLAAGVQAMAARRKGEGRDSETAIPLNGGLVMVLVLSIPLSIGLILAAPYVFPVLSSDAQVAEIGVPYLQVRLVAIVAVGANFAFRGYWNGISMSRLYLRTIVVMHVCNVVLSYVLIFGVLGAPELGATGAGIGTAASTFIGTAYYFYLGRKHAGRAGFLSGIPSWETMRGMIRLSVPSGVQQTFFAGGLTVFFVIVGRVGTVELAAASVLINLTLVAILPGLGLGLAAASLVGQALGRKDIDAAEGWGWDVVRVAAVVMGALGLPMLVAPGLILAPFFDVSIPAEAAALALAELPLRLVGATIIFDAVGMVLLNALVGAGATRMAMIVSILAQWGLFLPVAYVVGPVLGGGLLAIWIAQISYRSGLGLVLAVIWRRRGWASIEV
jgi:putative MATE family efflux protein